MIYDQKVAELIQKFPLFLPTVTKLNKASLTWMLGGSGCLFILGNERTPDDADLFIPDEQHDEADKLFNIKSFTYTSPAGPVRNSNPEGDHSIQFTSHLEFNFDKHYEFSITELVNQHKIKFEYQGVELFLLPPEDVLLIKALLQRGPQEGKQDVEDIRNFEKIYHLDQQYLKSRIAELGAEARVNHIL